MPKVYLTEAEQNRARLAENLRKIECGRSTDEMAKVIGSSKSTYIRRRQSPETLTYKEIDRLCRNAGVDIRDFVGAKLRLKGD